MPSVKPYVRIGEFGQADGYWDLEAGDRGEAIPLGSDTVCLQVESTGSVAIMGSNESGQHARFRALRDRWGKSLSVVLAGGLFVTVGETPVLIRPEAISGTTRIILHRQAKETR